MSIHEFSSYYNEKLLAALKLRENSNWIDSFHFTESNRDFRFNKKEYNFDLTHDAIDYHKLNGTMRFQRAHLRPTKSWRVLRRVPLDPWRNDEIQRNYAIKKFTPNKDDILILSDIDEIIDSRFSEELIQYVNKYGITTIKLHYTLYYFNLFSKNWVGPPDYSYRVFLMSGEYFNRNSVNSNLLRKAGERGDLVETVKCFPEYAGFHHSWLGDEKFLLAKLAAYPHAQYEHDESIYGESGAPDVEKLKEFLIAGKSVYGPSHKLELRPEIPLLESVESERNLMFKDLFL